MGNKRKKDLLKDSVSPEPPELDNRTSVESKKSISSQKSRRSVGGLNETTAKVRRRTRIAKGGAGTEGRVGVGSGSVSGGGSGSGRVKMDMITRLQAREYFLLLVEATMSLGAFVVEERNFSKRGLLEFHRTERQLEVFMLFTNGFGSLACMIIGWIADSYVTYYRCALFTVILHFTAVSLIFMERAITQGGGELQVDSSLPAIYIVVLMLIQSSNFIRLVYGLSGMSNRKMSVIHGYIFLQYWVSSRAAEGGIIVNAFSSFFNHFDIHLTTVAFILSGFSLFLFVYILRPSTRASEQAGLGCSLIGRLFLATFYKMFRIKRQDKDGNVVDTPEETTKTVAKAKQLLTGYSLMMPVFAVLFLTMAPTYPTLEPLIAGLKVEGFIKLAGLQQVARGVLSISMLASNFVVWPFLIWTNLIKRSFKTELLIGHFVLVLSWFYGALLMASVEDFQYGFRTGFIRVYNTRDSPVHFKPMDSFVFKHEFDVAPHKSQMLSFLLPPISKKTDWLFPVSITSDTGNTTTFMSLHHLQTIGYVILDREIVRIRGFIPLKEGPPGTNTLFQARLYIYNTARTLDGATLEIKDSYRTDITHQELTMVPGEMLVTTLDEGLYDFVIFQGDIVESVLIEQGGLYGILVHTSQSNRKLTVDVFRPGNTYPVWPYILMYVILGIAEGFAYPAICSITYVIAPQGLLAMSFAFITFMECLSLWVYYIGFVTWHEFMNSGILMIYGSFASGFFVLCVFVLVKYSRMYKE